MVRVESGFYGAHDVDRNVAMFQWQIFTFAEADAVFAGAGAFHGDGA